MKESLKKEIREINSLICKMPKTINESMEYSDYPMNAQEEPMDEPMPEEEPMQQEPVKAAPQEKPQEEGFNIEGFVDDIRKKSLHGMAQLADTPDDEKYQLLKKIWQICDKKPEQQSVFNTPKQNAQ